MYSLSHDGLHRSVRPSYANTGVTRQFNYFSQALTAQTPVFASLLSKDGQYYYNHFRDYFMQFDTLSMSFTYIIQTSHGTSMGMTEDDSGVVRSATHPNSGLVSFNPKTRQFRDYGFVYKQTWYMYQRTIAADDLGLIYIAIGSAKSQFVCFHPNTTQSWPLLCESQRIAGSPWLYRDNDGKVYGLNVNSSPIYKFYITGTQYLFYGNFQSGKVLKSFDPESKTFSIQYPNNGSIPGNIVTLSFNYTSQGATFIDMRMTPDGKYISGASQFPMNFFTMDENGNFTNYLAWDQFNVVKSVPFDSRYMFFGSYSDGSLLQYDTTRPRVNAELGNNVSNPILLASANPHIIRPSCIVIHPNKDLVLMNRWWSSPLESNEISSHCFKSHTTH
ncbi:hypothetical protein FDP41_002993 [Naegleria fowleri]|uniref:Uncharacterized protein n=1 Tax=Naegleria fowleri TaxID=5763 RepID=A0A6A5BTI0_NAEFO|nr:uncharacterized protein FDP41_002993 [Naegleria fowleri]KAF0977671.1 hypothetical protein FDP41_002993 [Naegleria fowleri]